MYNLKGFVSIRSLIDNTTGVISPIGEISTWSLTFTKERGEYESLSSPGFKLHTISSVDSILGKVKIESTLADHVLEVSKWSYEYAQTQIQPVSPSLFYDEVLAHFNGLITNFSFGPFITAGNINMPEWISWTSVANPANSIKIWFSDFAFSQQYDETEIIVIPPLDNLNDFFVAPNLLSIRLLERTATETMDLIQLAKDKNPETVIRTETYNYKNADFPGVTFPSNWSVLIYGIQGDNPDTIKDEIIKYILANSTHTRAEWTSILPDLFKRTEFIIIPQWYKYAIPNKTNQAGMYSAIVKPSDAALIAKVMAPEYDQTYVDKNILIFSHPYKSIVLSAVGGADNRDGKNAITDFFPDYINVGTNSLDFNRMSLPTQNWMYLLQEMLVLAETMTEYTVIPNYMRKLTRSNVLYISTTVNNVQYLVAAKVNLRLLGAYAEAGYAVPGYFLDLLEL